MPLRSTGTMLSSLSLLKPVAISAKRSDDILLSAIQALAIFMRSLSSSNKAIDPTNLRFWPKSPLLALSLLLAADRQFLKLAIPPLPR